MAGEEQGTTTQLTDDFVAVPGSGDDGGFAWYRNSQFCMATHSANAYIVVAVTPETSDDETPQSLRQRVPVLTSIMNTMLKSLR